MLTNTTITDNNCHNYAISITPITEQEGIVYISDESKNDVEIPIPVFRKMIQIFGVAIQP